MEPCHNALFLPQILLLLTESWPNYASQLTGMEPTEAVHLTIQNEMSDEDIILEIREDPQAFLLLYERYYEKILNYLYRQCYHKSLAEDLCAESFMTALKAIQGGVKIRCFQAWLYRIARNLFLSQQRRQMRWSSIWSFFSETPNIPSPDMMLIQDQKARMVRKTLKNLPAKYSQVLLLRFDEELDFRDIAEILAIKESSVRSRLTRGIQLLRQRLLENEEKNYE